MPAAHMAIRWLTIAQTMRKTAVSLLIALSFAQPVPACAPAPHPHENVYVVQESALIIWDPATGTEHFIRGAQFDSKGQDFGFLVPTPTQPELSAVHDRLFDTLERIVVPETVVIPSRHLDFTPILFRFFFALKRAPVAATSSVQVVATEHVAGYEAVVLKASDAGALQKWLAENGYDARPDLLAWLEPYVRMQWNITAFKVRGSEPRRSTDAVRMSFHTATPFFPYREPESQRQPSATRTARTLKVWFIGPERVEGTIGSEQKWPGTTEWSDLIDPAEVPLIVDASHVGLTSSRMTAMVDRSSPRPGVDDLFFHRANDQSVHHPPPTRFYEDDDIPVPADVVGAGALLFTILWRRRRRAASQPR